MYSPIANNFRPILCSQNKNTTLNRKYIDSIRFNRFFAERLIYSLDSNCQVLYNTMFNVWPGLSISLDHISVKQTTTTTTFNFTLKRKSHKSSHFNLDRSEWASKCYRCRFNKCRKYRKAKLCVFKHFHCVLDLLSARAIIRFFEWKSVFQFYYALRSNASLIQFILLSNGCCFDFD